MIKKFFLLFILTFLILSCVQDKDIFEPNDDFELARPIKFGKQVKIMFNKVNDIDIFTFNLDIPGNISLSTSIEKPVDAICLFDIFNAQYTKIYANIPTGEKVSLPIGKFFISIKDEKGKSFDKAFKINLDFEKVKLDRYEPNDSLRDAHIVKTGKKIKVNIFPLDDKDFFKFSLKDTGVVNFEPGIGKPANLELIMNLYNNNGELLLSNIVLPARVALYQDNYIIEITDKSTNSSDKTFEFVIDFKKEKVDKHEPNNSIDQAKAIELRKKNYFTLYPDMDKDFFKFKLDESSTISVEFFKSPPDLIPILDIFNQSGETVVEGAHVPNNFELESGIYIIVFYSKEKIGFSLEEFGFEIKTR